MMQSKKWLFKNIEIWDDFLGFLYGKDYTKLENEQSIVINTKSLKTNGCITSVDMFNLSLDTKTYISLHVKFSGKDATVGTMLIHEYKKNLPPHCSREIREMD